VTDRNETEDERLDRKWADLLQELRVMQTGAQLTAGFLLTLPFTTRFDELDTFQVRLYLALVLLAAVTTALVMSAVAVHRRLSGQHVKERVVRAGHRLTLGVLTTISLLITGMVVLIFDVVVDRTAAIAFGAGVAVAVVLLLVLVPHQLRERPDD
jgi:multidrug efflux pump subunit AcrB